MDIQGECAAGSSDALYFDVFDPGLPAKPQIRWAIGELRSRLGERGTAFRPMKSSAAGACSKSIVLLAGTDGDAIGRRGAVIGLDLPAAPDSFAIFRGAEENSNCIFVYGADLRGLVYAITELADRVRFAGSLPDALDFAEPLVGTPAAAIRSISKCFQSETEDLPWFHDRNGWEEYLTHLATHRFNRFSLTFGKQYNYPYGNEFVSDVYFHLAYPFLVSVPGHDVSISNMTGEERTRNLETLKFIAGEADRRGLEFQLALWTQSYDFDNCPNAKHQISGLGPRNIAAYCRDALSMLLAEVPAISGLTLRVHVESGIPEGDYAFWQTYFAAVKGAGRTIRLDLHAKGIDEKLIDTALDTGMPVCISPKYTSEHMGLPYHQMSIRPLELAGSQALPAGPGPEPRAATLYSGHDAAEHAGKWRFSEGSRKFMRYSYGDLLREDRPYGVLFRIWPGTTRILLWGDRMLAGGYGRSSTFCGSQGVELCEPLSFKGRMGTGIPGSRTGYQEKHLSGRHDWQKFEYTYRVWGRSLYDPEAEPEAFCRFLTSRFGAAGAACGNAVASASRILPLVSLAHAPTASNNSYWPEMYENMSVLHEAPHLPYGYELARPARFGTVGACDPQFFLSPSEFAACLLDGSTIRKLSPLTWANWLERHATAAGVEMGRALALAGNPQPELNLVRVDVTILAAIGRFFAEKVRAAVLWEYHLLTGDGRPAREALVRYRKAHDAWTEAANVGKDVYLPDITYGPHSWLRGRWDDRLPAIEKDIADMEAAAMTAGLPHRSDPLVERQVERILNWSASQSHPSRHVPQDRFVRGEAMEISIAPFGAGRHSVGLHYRHVNQSEQWQSAGMKWCGGEYTAFIPGEYTSSPYPIMYYFEISGDGVSNFYPGMVENLSNTPYFLACSSNDNE
ncbi:MAG: hypothetical protein AB7S92_14270 [Parvibaculaceae bacterium]